MSKPAFDEERSEDVVGAVHAQQCAGEVDAVVERGGVVERGHELASRRAVLVHPDHPDGAQAVLLDQRGRPPGGVLQLA